MVLPSALPVPSKKRIAVPMESIQVDTYFLVWLSYPAKPMPVNGLPIISPENSCSRKRPPRIILCSEVPVDSVGGLLGSHQDFTFAVQLPAKLASALWGAPGVPSFV